jgi:heme-degrading monooxygenase HmoA
MSDFGKETRLNDMDPDDVDLLLRRALRSEMKGFEALAQLRVAAQLGRVDRRMLASIYDVSEETITRWAKRQGFEEVEGPHGKRVYYDLDDVREKIGAESEDA